MIYSERITTMQSSPIKKLAHIASSAKAKGIKIYHLNICQPDIKTPKVFFEAVKNFNNEVLEYAVSPGLPELISSLQQYYTTYNMDFESDEILVTNGGSEALLFALMATCDPKDNILVPEPFYSNYNGFSQSINVNITPITTKAEEGFHLPSKEKIQSLITSKTKAILISNPGNPTGTVYTKKNFT